MVVRMEATSILYTTSGSSSAPSRRGAVTGRISSGSTICKGRRKSLDQRAGHLARDAARLSIRCRSKSVAPYAPPTLAFAPIVLQAPGDGAGRRFFRADFILTGSGAQVEPDGVPASWTGAARSRGPTENSVVRWADLGPIAPARKSRCRKGAFEHDVRSCLVLSG